MPRTAQEPPGSGGRTDQLVPQVPGIQPTGQPNGIPAAPPQPVMTPTNLPYGEAGQLQQAQQAVPLPGPPPPVGQQATGSSPDFATAMNAARQFTAPPNVGMMRPTDRPNEPVHAGLPGSPVSAPAPRQVGSLASMISAVASASGSAALSQLAARAASAGQ